MKWGGFMGFLYGGEQDCQWRVVVEGDFGETEAGSGVFGLKEAEISGSFYISPLF